MAYDNAAIIRRLFDEVWSKGELGTADELVAVNCISHDPISGDVKGLEALKAQVREYRAAFPDLRFTIQDILVSGDEVVTRWTATGTHRGVLMGALPTGKATSVEGMSIDRISSGKVVEYWAHWDTLKFMQNLGVVAPLGTEPHRADVVKNARSH